MANESSRYVIFGGGMVAGYAAKELVERGMASGELAIISADTAVPYERPPLSKGFLAGKDSEDSIRINPEPFYAGHGITLRLKALVSGIDTGRRTLRLRAGGELGFEKLVIATGARVRILSVPGSDLAGIYYLRSLDNSKNIRVHAGSAHRAVVVGGGFIAMEVASVLAQKGIPVTMLLREDRIWQTVFTPAMSAFFESYYTARGVELVKDARLAGFQGMGAIESVRLEDGRTLPCDLVVAGIGVQPVTEPLAGSGIEIDNGVVVNEFLETNLPGIYSAGDVANYQDVLYGKRRRVEHWDNAVSQGQHCAHLLLGERRPFVHVPYFFSDIFDLSDEFWGDPAGADAVDHRGDLSTPSFSVWWRRGQKLIAAFAMRRPDQERQEILDNLPRLDAA